MISDSYFDSFQTAKYRSPNPVQRYLIRRFLNQIGRLFDQTAPAASILEIGCGEGFISGQLSKRRPNEIYMGVDPNRTDLDNLTAKFPHIQTHQGSIYDLSFLNQSFEVIICAEVLEHLEEPHKALKQIVNMKPQWVLLSVPHEPWFCLSNFLRGKNIRRLGNDEDHKNLWSHSAFVHMLQDYIHIETTTLSYPWQLALGTVK